MLWQELQLRLWQDCLSQLGDPLMCLQLLDLQGLPLVSLLLVIAVIWMCSGAGPSVQDLAAHTRAGITIAGALGCQDDIV